MGWVWLVYALAVARLTNFMAHDTLTERVRDALDRVDAGRARRLLNALATCPWCLSVWIGAAAAPAVWWYGTRPWLLIPALALAFSQITGMTHALGRDG